MGNQRRRALASEEAAAPDAAVYSADHATGILLALVGMATLWTFLHSITFLGSVLDAQVELEPGSAWIVNSLSTFTVFLILFCLPRTASPLSGRRVLVMVVACFLAAGVALLLAGNLVLDSSACNYAGNACIAWGTAPMIIMWGELFKFLNPKGEQLLVALAAAALAVALYVVEMLLPVELAAVVLALLPLSSLCCIVRAHDLLRRSSDTWKAGSGAAARKSPALFFVCIAVFSIPYNYLRASEGMQAVFANPLDWPSVMAIAFVALVAIALAEHAAERRGILLVPGFVLALLSAAMLVHLLVNDAWPLAVPSLLYTGYYLFLAMVYLALGPIVATTDENPTRLFAGAMLANVAGLLIGTVMGGMEGPLGTEGATLTVLGVTYALVVMGFVLLSSRSYSLFRVNCFDEDEYSFEYLVPLVPRHGVQAVAGTEESAVTDGRSMLDAIADQCETVGERYLLSARENEVLVELVRGRTIASIAGELVVSENTIKAHTKAIYRKLDVHTREELLQRVEDAPG